MSCEAVIAMASAAISSTKGGGKLDGEASGVFPAYGSGNQRKTVPNVFIAYFLEAIRHPSFMYVSKLAACCAMLFLERSDNDLLKVLCEKWAVCFLEKRNMIAMHYLKVTKHNGPKLGRDEQGAPESTGSTGAAVSRRGVPSALCSSSDANSSSDPNQAVLCSSKATPSRVYPLVSPATVSPIERIPLQSSEKSPNSASSSFLFPSSTPNARSGIPGSCEFSSLLFSSLPVPHYREEETKKEVIQRFMSVLKASAFLYFSYNWGKTDFLMQINREYAYYIRDTVLPMCVALEPSEGFDEYPLKTSVLSPFRVLYRLANPRSASYEFIVPGSTSLRNTVDIHCAISSGSITPGVRSPSGASPTSGQEFPNVRGDPSRTTLPKSQSLAETTYVSTLEGKEKELSQLLRVGYRNYHSAPSQETDASSDAGASLSSITTKNVTDLPDSKSSRTSNTNSSLHNITGERLPSCSTSDKSKSVVLLPSNSFEASNYRTPTNLHSRRFFQRLEEKSASRIFHLTFDTYREFIMDNTTGILIVFHGMYCAKSNALRKVLDVFMERNPVHPMPKVAVVNTVSEPKLAAFYNIWWLPSIIYTPPYPRNGYSRDEGCRSDPPPQTTTPIQQGSNSKCPASSEEESAGGTSSSTHHAYSTLSTVLSKAETDSLKEKERMGSSPLRGSAVAEKDRLMWNLMEVTSNVKEGRNDRRVGSLSVNRAPSSAPVTPAQPHPPVAVSQSRCSSPLPSLSSSSTFPFSKPKGHSWATPVCNYAEDMNYLFGFPTSPKIVDAENAGEKLVPPARVQSPADAPSFSQSPNESTATRSNKSVFSKDGDADSVIEVLENSLDRKEKDSASSGSSEINTESQTSAPSPSPEIAVPAPSLTSRRQSTMKGETLAQRTTLPPVDNTYEGVEGMEELCGVYRIFPFNRAPSVHVLAEWIRSEGTYVAADIPHRSVRAADHPSARKDSEFSAPNLSSEHLFHTMSPTDSGGGCHAIEGPNSSGSAGSAVHAGSEVNSSDGSNSASSAHIPIQSSMLLTSDQLKASLHAAVTFLKRIDRPADASLLKEVSTLPPTSIVSSMGSLATTLFSSLSSSPEFLHSSSVSPIPNPSPSSAVPIASPARSSPSLSSSPQLIGTGEKGKPSSKLGSAKEATSSLSPPFFVFLGGGMAAGKSTALRAFYQSTWWQERAGGAGRDGVVVVAADEFKTRNFDPNNQEAHVNSTKSAELLLIQSINQCRNIILDGTMMWAPFVVDVVKVIRAAQTTIFKPGQGYHPDTGKERYFEFARARPVPYPHPYKILCLGITVEPNIAVPLGLLRHFSTGRGVRIRDQLRSFKLFSQNFPLYATLVDAIYLLDNNAPADAEQGELPRIIAMKEEEDTSLQILDEEEFALFQRHRDINILADNVDALYEEEVN